LLCHRLQKRVYTSNDYLTSEDAEFLDIDDILPASTLEDVEFLDIDAILAGVDIGTLSQHQDATFMPTAERPIPEDPTAMTPVAVALSLLLRLLLLHLCTTEAETRHGTP
jgi:hypothetical protein